MFLTLVLFIALLEYNRMGLGDSCRLEQWVCALAGALVAPLLFYAAPEQLLPLFTAVFLILSLFFLFRFKEIETVHHQLGWLLSGLIYLPFLLGHLMPLRMLEDGRRWIFLTLLIIMACDTFAYFFGRKLGRRKLYPAVSPNKSVEGGLAGLAGSVIAALAASFTFLPQLGMVGAVLIGLLLGTAGQLGDLFESLLKRACKVKDSGTIIPGHGGLLDRLDSLLFAFPLVYYIARFCYGG